MKGAKEPSDLVNEISNMDAFLMCYDIENDPNKGSNSHKILEYLSTGKVIIANHVSDYKDYDLFPMLNDKNTTNLIELFREVMQNVSFYNSIEYQNKRIRFALSNTYAKQIEIIESAINGFH